MERQPLSLFLVLKRIYQLQPNQATFTLRSNIGLLVKQVSNELYNLSFIFEHSRVAHKFQAAALTLECIKLFDGQHSNLQIANKLSIPIEEVDGLCEYLVDQNIIHRTCSEHHDLNNRFSRQLNFFLSFETQANTRFEMQQRIEQAHVVVIGIGSVGTWLVESLARNGVGELTLIDDDKVELNNLPRQGLFAETDVGTSKTAAAAQRLQQINPKITINTVDHFIANTDGLTPHLALNQTNQAAVVVNCADQPSVTFTNGIVSDACFSHGIPHVLCGGYDGHLSFIGQTVIPHQTACWRCYAESEVYESQLHGYQFVAITPTQVIGGTLAQISSICANIHALEVIKVITQYCKPAMQNGKAELDFSEYNLTHSSISKRPDCRQCGK